MRMLYSPADWPDNRALPEPLDRAANRLYQKLIRLDITALGISDYNQHYLQGLVNVRVLRVMLQRYAYLLAWALDQAPAPYDRFVLVDYGGGTGILSLLAKEFGVGVVIYNDIYKLSARDARVIATALNLPAEEYVTGDLAELQAYFEGKQLKYHALVSYDVIEHIYDIEGFLTGLPTAAAAEARIVMASSANPFNPRIRAKLTAHHRQLETVDRVPATGDKQRDTLKAYARVRAEIIHSHAPGLSPAEVEDLVRLTRGLIQADILQCLTEYQTSGRLPRPPLHPTNTCDPYTGNWAEHLMDIPSLAQLLQSNGFEASILRGYYGSASGTAKGLAARGLDTAIYYLGKSGLALSPYFILFARKCDKAD